MSGDNQDDRGQVRESGRVEAHAGHPALIEARARRPPSRPWRAPCERSWASMRCTLTASGVVWVGRFERAEAAQPMVPM